MKYRGEGRSAADIVMAYVLMAYIVMAYVLMAYIVMAYVAGVISSRASKGRLIVHGNVVKGTHRHTGSAAVAPLQGARHPPLATARRPHRQ